MIPDPEEWSAAALTDRLADYLVNAYTDGRGYDPADPDDVAVTLKDGFDIVLAEMREAQRVPVCHVGWPGCDWEGPHTHAPFHQSVGLGEPT